MANPIFVAIDFQNRTLSGAFGSVAALPNLYAYTEQQFQVQLLNPPTSLAPGAGLANQYTKADFTGFTMDITIGAIPTGNGGAFASRIQGLIWDGNNKQYLGTLDLSQAAVLALLTGVPSASVWLEFSLWVAGLPQQYFGFPVTLVSVLDNGSVSNPPAGPVQYPTVPDVRAGFLNKGPTKADSKIWLSPDGTKARLMYLGNDGEFKYTDIIPPPQPLY